MSDSKFHTHQAWATAITLVIAILSISAWVITTTNNRQAYRELQFLNCYEEYRYNTNINEYYVHVSYCGNGHEGTLEGDFSVEMDE